MSCFVSISFEITGAKFQTCVEFLLWIKHVSFKMQVNGIRLNSLIFSVEMRINKSCVFDDI